jgi:hypothetical protein
MKGFGLLGERHTVNVMCKGKLVTAYTFVWLFPGMARRLWNLDESSVAGTDTHSSRDKVLAPEGMTSSQPKSKKAQTHTTYVAVIGPPDYPRIAMVDSERAFMAPEIFSRAAAKEAAVAARLPDGALVPGMHVEHDGCALPGMVRRCAHVPLRVPLSQPCLASVQKCCVCACVCLSLSLSLSRSLYLSCR